MKRPGSQAFPGMGPVLEYFYFYFYFVTLNVVDNFFTKQWPFYIDGHITRHLVPCFIGRINNEDHISLVKFTMRGYEITGMTMSNLT